MNLKEIMNRIQDGNIKVSDIPIIAFCILCAIMILGGWIGCIIWFFVGLACALMDGVSKLITMVLPCIIIFSILSAILCFVYMYAEEYLDI